MNERLLTAAAAARCAQSASLVLLAEAGIVGVIYGDDPGTAPLVNLRDIEARGAASERAVEWWSVEARAGDPSPSPCEKVLAVVVHDCAAPVRRGRLVDVSGCEAPVGLPVRNGQAGIGCGFADRVAVGKPRAREPRDAPKNGLVLGDIGRLFDTAQPATGDVVSRCARGRRDKRDRCGQGKNDRQTRFSLHGSASTRFTASSLAQPAAVKAALAQPFGASPYELAQQHAAELGPVGRRILKRGEDRLPLGDREREHFRLAAECGLKAVGEVGVVDEAGKLEDGLVGDGKPCEVHATTATLHERQFGLEGQSAGNYKLVLRWGAGAAPHLAFASAKVFSSGELGTRRTPYTERDS